MRYGLTIRLAMGLIGVLTASVASAAPAPKWTGVWRNASNTVRIRAAPCANARARMCGTVIWASAKAKADVAARGRTLVGARLFRDFRDGGDGKWHGEVWVPDIDKTFTGTITVNNATTLTGEGCLFRNLGCKTQMWTRVGK